MKTRVARWGNSLAFRIPKRLAESYQISEGSDLEVIEEEGELRIRPVRTKTHELSELLKLITPENLHEEFVTGNPQGKEIW